MFKTLFPASLCSDLKTLQAMDLDNSCGLDSKEFCVAMKKLVSGAKFYIT